MIIKYGGELAKRNRARITHNSPDHFEAEDDTRAAMVRQTPDGDWIASVSEKQPDGEYQAVSVRMNSEGGAFRAVLSMLGIRRR